MRQINIYISKKEDLSEKYNYEVLSNEINSYIIGECLPIKNKENIVINIHTDNELSAEDKQYIDNLIKNNYKELYKEKTIIKEYQHRQSLLLAVIGIFFIILSNILKKENIISEILLIAGWVSLWEVIYKILFDNVKDKIELLRYKKLFTCKINYKIKKKP